MALSRASCRWPKTAQPDARFPVSIGLKWNRTSIAIRRSGRGIPVSTVGSSSGSRRQASIVGRCVRRARRWRVRACSWPRRRRRSARGFRPCLRCRPELAPAGTHSPTVTPLEQAIFASIRSRAPLGDTVEDLAAHTGFSTRQLRRLTLRAFGVHARGDRPDRTPSLRQKTPPGNDFTCDHCRAQRGLRQPAPVQRAGARPLRPAALGVAAAFPRPPAHASGHASGCGSRTVRR